MAATSSTPILDGGLYIVGYNTGGTSSGSVTLIGLTHASYPGTTASLLEDRGLHTYGYRDLNGVLYIIGLTNSTPVLGPTGSSASITEILDGGLNTVGYFDPTNQITSIPLLII